MKIASLIPTAPGNGKEETEYFNPGNYCVTKQILMDSNKIGHPTVIMRRNSIMKLPFLYETIYNGAEDYKLVATVPREFLKKLTEYEIIGKVVEKQDYILKVGNKKYYSYDELGLYNHFGKEET